MNLKNIFKYSFLLLCIFAIPILALSVNAAGNNAQFISQNIPATMIADQTYSVSITMKNTGTTAWTEAGKFRLGSQNPRDNGIWRNGRVLLAASESIASGAGKTFTFDIKAPVTPGTYNFQWQMVQENKEWFGSKTTNVVVTVTAAGNQICIPSAIQGCKVCNAAGTAWIDTNSKCAAGQTCQAGVCVAASATVTIKSFESKSDPIPQLWTYYTAVISSPVNKTVKLSLDIYRAVNGSHPDGHHGYFTKQISLVANQDKTIRIRYNWQGIAQYNLGAGWLDADKWYNSNWADSHLNPIFFLKIFPKFCYNDLKNEKPAKCISRWPSAKKLSIF